MVYTRAGTATSRVTKYAQMRSKGTSQNHDGNHRQPKKSGKRNRESKLGKRQKDTHVQTNLIEVPRANVNDIRKIAKAGSKTTSEISFWPDVVFGDEPNGLSKIERADLRVRQWESILKTHEKELPEAVATCQTMLTRARKYRASLQANPLNHVVVDEIKRHQVVQDRILVLKKTLDTAKFEPERLNIQGAIAAYESGEIVYSKQYTLIWRGRVVDQADSYGKFTQDRLSRLDRYAELYGPHWLWWESPLWLEPSQQIVARGCQIIHRQDSPSGFGQFFINQGFVKRADWVTRMPQTSSFGPSPFQERLVEIGNTVYCQNYGPRLLFKSLLDSGATYPSLFPDDFEALGVAPELYGAQSVITMETSNGTINSRIYEMHVEIAGNEGTPIIDPTNPLQPAFPHYIGGLSPVVLDDKIRPLYENGELGGQRLSGVMPFLAPYLSITPGTRTVLMGEDRNDVLGAHKMPPQRRWLVDLDHHLVSREHWDKYDNPMITFRHRNGLVIDEDLAPGVAKFTVCVGQPDETYHVFDSKSLPTTVNPMQLLLNA